MTARPRHSSRAPEPAGAALRRCGLLLLADNRLPSVAGIVAGEPIRGSWWAHPSSHAIFHAASRLAARPDVLTTKLLARKVTFVQRSLWPALCAVGGSRQSWQSSALSPLAASLLDRVEREGRVRIDELASNPEFSCTPRPTPRELAAAARDLESRLLVFSEQFHSESGAHSKRLESWTHWARRARLRRSQLTPAAAMRQLEQAARCLGGAPAAKLLPWPSSGGR